MVLTTNITAKEILLIKQELALVKFLSSNTEVERNKALKKIEKWLTYRSATGIDYGENECKVLWKGLFYCLWMADKPLYQEEVAEKISKLVHGFTKYNEALLFIKSFFTTISQEWLGIDHLRFDKCLMLIRRMVRQSMVYVKENSKWNQTEVEAFAKCYQSILKKSPNGLIMHLSEIYLIELAKVSEGSISSEIILELVRPFAEHLRKLTDGRLMLQIVSPIFFHLIRQTETGIEHQEKLHVWKNMGYPGGSIDALQKVDPSEDSEAESEVDVENEASDEEVESQAGERPMDTRAGRVDVELPLLEINPRQFVEMFNEMKNKKDTTTKARKQLTTLMNKFSALSHGKYPLGMSKVELPPKENWSNISRTAANKLVIDLIDDEIKKTKMLNGLDTDECQFDSSVGKWSVKQMNSKLRKKERKKMKEKICDNRWEVVPAENKGNNIVNGKCNENGNSFIVTSRLAVDQNENKNGIQKRKLEEKCNGDAKNKKKRRKKDKTQLADDNFNSDIEWETPLQEGETEMFIPNKTYAEKRAKQGLPVPKPEFLQKSPKTPEPNRSLLYDPA